MSPKSSGRTRRAGARARAEPKAVVAGHAFGNWIARMAAACHPRSGQGRRRSWQRRIATFRPLARHDRPHHGSQRSRSRPRLKDLQEAFFAPGHEAHRLARRLASAGCPRAAPGRARDCHGAILVAGGRSCRCWTCRRSHDPFAPRSGSNQLRDELGARVSIDLIEDAGHALLPEQPARSPTRWPDSWRGSTPLNHPIPLDSDSPTIDYPYDAPDAHGDTPMTARRSIRNILIATAALSIPAPGGAAIGARRGGRRLSPSGR